MKIRIGNDFVFNWAIERGGLPEDLSSVLEKHLHLSVFGKRVELIEGVDYDITGNVIRIEVTPAMANIIGTYKAEFHYILPDSGLIDDDRKCAVDVDAFQIVAKTAQADDSTEFSMTSDMAIAFKGDKGDKGDSAYQVWLEEGNTGTEEDYFAYLRQPAVDAGALISELEGEIQVNEGLRIQAESSRESAESLRIEAELLRQSNTQEAISNAENATENANTAAQNADDARLAIQGDLALKADQADLVQLAGEVSQAVKKTDSKIYIGAVRTELDRIYNGPNSRAMLGAVLSDGRFICTFGNNITSFNDVMGISWQRTDILPNSIPYERNGYIYVASATQLYKLTLEGIDVKTYPIANINSVAVAPNGNIAVGRGGAVGEKTVIYMDNDGLEIWSNTEVANCTAADIDGNGNVLAGHYANQAGDGLRIYDSVGVNKKQINRLYIVDAKFDNDDNVIVLSSVSSGGIYKYDKSLNQLWYRSEVVSNYTARSKFSIGDDNTIYTPSFSTVAGSIDCSRFTADGDLIYKFASGGAARAVSLDPDNNGYVYLTNNLSANNTISRFKEYNKVRIW